MQPVMGQGNASGRSQVVGGNKSSINLSEVISILGDDSGSLLARVFAPRLTLQQLLCFGLVNKGCHRILRDNLWEFLLGCCDVKDQDSLISRLVNGNKTGFLKTLVLSQVIQVEGVNLDEPNIALHKAVQANAYAKVLFILGAGADINSEVRGGASHPQDGQPGGKGVGAWRGEPGAWSPDDPWVERGCPWVERGQRNPLNYQEASKAGITALMRACACKYCADVYDPALLGAKEDKVDESDSHDGTMIKLLLQLGADPNIGVWRGAEPNINVDRDGENDIFYETALNLCFGNVDLMKCLLTHGADVVRCQGEVDAYADEPGHVYASPLLHIACGINDVATSWTHEACDEIVPLMIEHGGCVNDTCEINWGGDWIDWTPLQIALYSATQCERREGKIPDKKLKTIQTLIEAGADVMQAVQVRGEDEAGIPSLVISQQNKGRKRKKSPCRPLTLPPEIVHLMMNCGSFQCSSSSSSSSMKK